jgi:alpha-ketoglutaric semialdehyde dehydrogenase
MTKPMQHASYVRGRWHDRGDRVENRNPSDLDDVVGVAMHGDAALALDAVDAARGALPQWSLASPWSRAEVLDRTGTRLLERKHELGCLLAREEGKTLPEATAEVARAGQIFKYFAGEALRMTGDRLDSVRPGIDVSITREPVGVVALITPWNFPIAIPSWKIAPALAFGNTVLFKPASTTPACASALVETLAEAGLPAGVLNLVHGSGSVVGGAWIESRDVAAVSLTGSVGTGARVIARCAETGKRVQAEMGGKNPLVVVDDADLEVAVSCAINGAYFSTGQRCTASSRLIVTRGIYERFVETMTAAMRALVVGHALEADTQIGPVVDEQQLAQDEQYLRIARDEGATVVGGERIDRATRGHFLAPALLLDTRPDMRVNREEIFGPVASVIVANDYDEALAIANDTEFGLCAGIITTSLATARHFQRHAEAGMVMVNLPTAGVDPHVPFGGRKASSYGPREQGAYAREFYTQIKTSYVG